MKKVFLIVIMLFLCGVKIVSAQEESRISIPFINVSYSYQFPFADLSKRFGSNSTVGVGFSYKTQDNYLWGIDWNFIFSSNVKDKNQYLRAISNSEGEVINSVGQYALISISERGHSFLLRAGKIFSLWPASPNSGFFATVGLCLLTHKIKFDVYKNDTPQLSYDYKKGYDRCSVGPLSGIQFGYIFFSDNRLLNFKAEIEAYYGITHSIRPYDFFSMQRDNDWYHDVFVGAKVSWLIPLYKKSPRDYYYY